MLQFDVEDHVRVIAFKSAQVGYQHDPTALSDVWLAADDFYGILHRWRNAFEAEWMTIPKVPESIPEEL